ncbi:MAG: transcription-repair coupling factor, partial [Bacteroidales bacterium]
VFISSVISTFEFSSVNIIIAADKKSAYFFVSDFYNFFEDDNIFFLPSAKEEYSNNSIREISRKVQRTSVLSVLSGFSNKEEKKNLEENFSKGNFIINENILDKEKNSKNKPVIIISYPESIKEPVLKIKKTRENILKIIVGEKLTHEFIKELLFGYNFQKVDFVIEPGQFALRGGLIDIFSFSDNQPYRIDFFGEEVESIRQFDINTQRSIKELKSVEIYPNLYENFEEKDYVDFFEIVPENSVIWELQKTIDINERTTEIEYGEREKWCVPQPTFNKNFEILYQDIRQKEEKGYHVNILSPNLSQTFRLQQILRDIGGKVNPSFIPISLHEGYVDHISKNCYYTDHQIFERYHKIKIKRQVEKSERLTINELSAFQIGDYVVHIDHGVGKYGGLVKTNINGNVQEAIKLIYKDNDVIFVSIHGIHRISKYKSKDGEPPKVYKLGTKAWENLKNQTKTKVKDIAKDLINLYSERRETRGFAFSADNFLQNELESSFIYEDTPDQQKSILAVKDDMESICPMDRLICGDVGFGKTEVAIRAAFKAVCDSKQVAVLVPTTILSLQHYHTFHNRLKDFPCTVDYVSRLRSPKEMKDIKEKLEQGKIDILIGTHKLLGKEIKFKDLGLLIIDEEQKFGVTAKERLRQLKLSVDTLTLTATPIPRTLQFSLLGARDLSIINTPPPNRLPVHTEIIDFNEEYIKDIIDQEIERGGQVFFIHNKIEDILSVEDIIRRICPTVKTCIAHGKMESAVLEKKILDFIEGEYDVLISTTIIENGIDIPNANTMIINQAQNFGLSDLHQLRGRVGRSNVKAFCYLVIPSITSLSDDARRRLKAIETFSDLGSGFNIAMQDLDIRGAGNLLGAEQSGFIAEIGFETYQKILNEALSEMNFSEENKGDQPKHILQNIQKLTYISDCQIDTDLEILIPDDYINIQAEKIRLYKELDGIQDEEILQKFTEEMQDRFGPIPYNFLELINIVRLRREAIQLGIERIVLKNGIMLAYFISNQMSPFYQSKIFSEILNNLQKYGRKYVLIEQNKKLYIKALSVNSVEKAVLVLQDILPLHTSFKK